MVELRKSSRCMYICLYINVCKHLHIYTWIHGCIYTYIYRDVHIRLYMCIAVIERYSCQYIGQSFDTDWEKENSYLTVLVGTEFYANRTSLWWINIANMQVKFSMFNRRYIFIGCHFSLLCLFISGFWGDSLRDQFENLIESLGADWRKWVGTSHHDHQLQSKPLPEATPVSMSSVW